MGPELFEMQVESAEHAPHSEQHFCNEHFWKGVPLGSAGQLEGATHLSETQSGTRVADWQDVSLSPQEMTVEQTVVAGKQPARASPRLGQDWGYEASVHFGTHFIPVGAEQSTW